MSGELRERFVAKHHADPILAEWMEVGARIFRDLLIEEAAKRSFPLVVRGHAIKIDDLRALANELLDGETK